MKLKLFFIAALSLIFPLFVASPAFATGTFSCTSTDVQEYTFTGSEPYAAAYGYINIGDTGLKIECHNFYINGTEVPDGIDRQINYAYDPNVGAGVMPYVYDVPNVQLSLSSMDSLINSGDPTIYEFDLASPVAHEVPQSEFFYIDYCNYNACNDPTDYNGATFGDGYHTVEICGSQHGGDPVCGDREWLGYIDLTPNVLRPTPTPAYVPPSLDPVSRASISAATGSIVTTASGSILSGFRNVLPYILLLVGLFVAYKLVRKWMSRQKGIDEGWIDGDGNISDPDIFEQMQGDKVGQADIWQSDFDENGKIDPKAYALHWENNLADDEVFNPEKPAEPSDWMESAGGIEQHFADQGKDDTFYGGK